MTAPLAAQYSKEQFQQMLNEHRSIAKIAAHIGRDRRSVSRAMKYHGLHEPGQRYKFYDTAYTQTQRAIPEDNHRFSFNILQQQSDRYLSMNRDDTTLNLTMPDEWFGIAFMADMHIGNLGTDHSAIEQDSRLIASTDGLYCVLGGDMIDNHIKHLAAIIASPSSPKQQLEAFEYILGILYPKLLAMCGGNHEFWSKSVSGIDILSRIAQERKIFYAPHGLTVNLQTATWNYCVYLRHKYRFNSNLNLCNTVKQMWANAGVNFDVGVVCHLHEAATETFERHGLPRIAVRTGTYNVLDSFAEQHGFKSSDYPIVPVVLFNPQKRKLLHFVDLAEGADCLQWKRSRT